MSCSPGKSRRAMHGAGGCDCERAGDAPETPDLYFVKVSSSTDDYCLMYGPGTERWTGTKAQAEKRAAALTATSYTKSVYVIEKAPKETA